MVGVRKSSEISGVSTLQCTNPALITGLSVTPTTTTAMAPEGSTKAVSEDPVDEQEEGTSKLPEPEATAERSSSSNSPTSDSEAKPSEASETTVNTASQWQAVWAPQYNAYYFFNAATQETTWTNPLQPEASTSSAAAAPTAEEEATEEAEASSSTGPTLSAVAVKHAALQAAATAQGIDPLLAHLDPTLLASIPGGSSIPGG